MRWFSIVTVAALFYGCGGKEHPDLVTMGNTGGSTGPVTTGGRSSGGSGGGPGSDAGSGAGPDTPGGAGGDGGGGGEAVVDARAPIVEITSPAAVSDPDQGEVLLGSNVTVLCTASKSKATGSVAVDASKVKIAMLDANGKVLKEVGGAAANGGEYTASFVISDQPNGVVSFRCTASDVAAPPRTGSTQLSTFIDHGPKITITKPMAGQILPLKVPVAFEFSVEPWPLADGDVGAAIDEVRLSVLDQPVAGLALAPKRPGVYIATIDFADPVLFPDPPSTDVPVLVTVTNKRSPMAALRSEAYVFKLDGDGPVIKILLPKVNDIVGPKTRTLKFTVTDLISGVDKNTVTVSLNGVEFPFGSPSTAWTENKGTYTFGFSDTQIEGSVAQATINIHAADVAGNGADGESLIIYLDDYPPVVSLDPPLVRVSGNVAGKPTCSSVFDPLGAAVSDLDTIADAATFRVLVWDETNHAIGSIVDYLSGADKSTAFLYLQPDPEQPLLVDTDHDPLKLCDHVNTKDADGKDLQFIHMLPVDPQGNFPNDPVNFGTREPAINPDTCGISAAMNGPLCTAHRSDMTYVIKHEIVGSVEPVVYARDPLATSPLACTGNSWEVRGLAGHSGWVCMAAVASDFVQNEGVSRPLRVCIDDDDDTSTSPCDGIEPPSCTDGCVLPPNFPSRVIRY